MRNSCTYLIFTKLKLYYKQFWMALCCCFLYVSGAFSQSSGNASVRLTFADIQSFSLTALTPAGTPPAASLSAGSNSGVHIEANQQLSLRGNLAVRVSKSVYRDVEVLGLLRSRVSAGASNHTGSGTLEEKLLRRDLQDYFLMPNSQSLQMKANRSAKGVSQLVMYDICPL